MLKKITILLMLMFALLPFYNIANAVDTAGDPNPDVPTNYIDNQEIENIKKIIGENTPEFLSKPVIACVEFFENIRKDMNSKTENQIVHPIFNKPIIFYAILFVIFILILRSTWRLIF